MHARPRLGILVLALAVTGCSSADSTGAYRYVDVILTVTAPDASMREIQMSWDGQIGRASCRERV